MTSYPRIALSSERSAIGRHCQPQIALPAAHSLGLEARRRDLRGTEIWGHLESGGSGNALANSGLAQGDVVGLLRSIVVAMSQARSVHALGRRPLFRTYHSQEPLGNRALAPHHCRLKSLCPCSLHPRTVKERLLQAQCPALGTTILLAFYHPKHACDCFRRCQERDIDSVPWRKGKEPSACLVSASAQLGIWETSKK